MAVTRKELHRLVDEVPAVELDRASECLRHLIERHKDSVTFRRHFRPWGPSLIRPTGRQPWSG
jgi:hypothetical protein